MNASSGEGGADDGRQVLGRVGERLAAEHYERLGYVVLARRYRTRHGELDLVVADARAIVFCEVKARRAGCPWDALTSDKRERVRRMASAWLRAADPRPRRPQLRFDAIGVTLDAQGRLLRLDHLEGAF